MAGPGAETHDGRESSEREGGVRELRAVLLSVPPLLADLISRVATSRLEQYGIRLSILAEIADVASLGGRLAELAPDLAIMGQAAITRLPAGMMAPSIPALVLSADLSHIAGPGPDDMAPLTPESLVAALRAVIESDGRTP
jgi:hypothetical protein